MEKNMNKGWEVRLGFNSEITKAPNRDSARALCEKYIFDKLSHNGEDLADPNSQLHIRLRELNIEFGRGGDWFGSGEGEDENDNPAYMVEAFREE